jgi:uncharacterized protein YndB with AHSA1/START domain
MSVAVQDILVRKSVVVETPVAHAFNVFTEHFNTWWPRSHHLGSENFTAIVEPHAGGRWFERGDDGVECEWGRVLEWEPPTRLLLTWDLNADWKYDAALGTEVEIKFVAETASRTRVELEHRKLERYGDKAEAMRAIFDSAGAWVTMLDSYKEVAERKAA